MVLIMNGQVETLREEGLHHQAKLILGRITGSSCFNGEPRCSDPAGNAIQHDVHLFRPPRVDQAWIGYSSGRIFVATVASDLNSAIVQAGVDSFDAASGMRQWTHHQKLKVSVVEAADPIRVFSASENALTYSIGAQTWSLRASDGAVLSNAEQLKPNRIPDSRAITNLLWPPSSMLVDGRKLFAFTPAGHAYAMTAN